MDAAKLAKRYRVEDGRDFRLADIDPGGHDIGKGKAKSRLKDTVKDLRKLQARLYAQGKWAVLIVLQAMDAAGKDSAIARVMSGINPQGCDVHSFKAPSPVELKHDFLWRHAVALPTRGRIGIFNRSHYEEVLVVRVHPELLAAQGGPDPSTEDIWQMRYGAINAFEQHLAQSGTVVLKFFLHISKDEQARRFLDRIDEPDKNWKFSFNDISERARWDDYMTAYEAAIRHTAQAQAPWFVVPANNKWYARLVISAVLAETLRGLDLRLPEVSDEEKARMAEARAILVQEAELETVP